MNEPLAELFTSSKYLILDFKAVPSDINEGEDIREYFRACEIAGKDPRTPENRQLFHNRLLMKAGKHYLIGRYGEDRSSMIGDSAIAHEQRFIHLGIDIFCKDLEPVYAPCDGEVVRVGRETEAHSFGNYLFFKPQDASLPYLFFGHLSNQTAAVAHYSAHDKIAVLGDYQNNENGGWSRHLHLQLFTELTGKDERLIGYSTANEFADNRQRYPDPLAYFPEWSIA